MRSLVAILSIGFVLALSNQSKAAVDCGNQQTQGDIVQCVLGNTTNPTSRDGDQGVTPSLAPGPWACADSNDCSLGAKAGGSIGEFIGMLSGNGKASFANHDDRDPGTKNFNAPYEHGGVNHLP